MLRKLVLGAGSVILLAVSPLASGVVPERDSEGLQVIQAAIESAGGARNWEQAGTLVVHEIQSRYMPKGSSEVRLVHYLDTNRKRYRVEIEGEEGKKVFGWDGESFWATLNAQKGDASLLGEAQRSIANGYYRFGLPFNLWELYTVVPKRGAIPFCSVCSLLPPLPDSQGWSRGCSSLFQAQPWLDGACWRPIGWTGG